MKYISFFIYQLCTDYPNISQWCDHSPRVRHPGMWSQVGLRKHHYEQSYWRWWNSSWAISNPTRWCYQSVVLNIPANLENVSFHSSPKECSNYNTILLISHASKVKLKILQARLQPYVNHELPDVPAGFRKARETREQTANIRWIIEKARKFQKKSTSASLTTPKPLTVGITTNCGKILKRW